jgi:methionyl aminopeptidase
VVILRSPREIAMMRKAGLVVWEAHRLAAGMIRPGVTTGEIDAAIEQLFRKRGAVSLFKHYQPEGPDPPPPFPAVCCTSINEVIVHGIPGPRKLLSGDILSLDIGCKLGGWCGDAAATYPVGDIPPRLQQLLEVTRGALDLAIETVGKLIRQRTERTGGGKSQANAPWPQWTQVATKMAKYVRDAGFSVVEDFVGHGIGKRMHEDPQVPNFPSRRSGKFEIRPGLVIAIEPMVNLGTKKVRGLPDRWTQQTADGKPSAHFEHTIAVSRSGAHVLTAGPDQPEDAPA